MSTRLLAYLLIVFHIVIGVSCGFRAGNVVLIPMGFRGWVVIRHDVAGAPVFGHERFKMLIKIPESGLLSSSSDWPSGYGTDEYYLVGRDGQRVSIHSQFQGCNDPAPCIQEFEFISSPIKATLFFVGNKQDLAQHPKPTLP